MRTRFNVQRSIVVLYNRLQQKPKKIYVFRGLFFTSSSLHACNKSFVCVSGAIPEWPLCQSYDTAYANMVPLRLKDPVVIGLGAGSKANHVISYPFASHIHIHEHFSRIRESLSQK